ncbi:MAG: NAD(P)H-binding protein [Pseudomonadota bacterium]
MLAVTGANGQLGQRLLCALAPRQPVRALVRSSRARDAVARLALGSRVETRVVDYRAGDDLAAALAGCAAVVHLPGIIRESRNNRFTDAHERACRALADGAARAGVRRVVYTSIHGANPESLNACLASKGAAERLLHEGAVPASVLRLPMVLGEGDFAARALAARARRRVNLVLRGASLEQPIYAGDVVTAVRAVLDLTSPAPLYELAGPESLPRAALIRRAAGVLGRRTRVVSVPLVAGLAAAWALERLSDQPPVTRAMLGVLDHDDHIDPAPAAAALGMTLTPLDATLARCLRGPAAPVD